MKKLNIISDPYPRTLNLIFSKKKLDLLNKKFNIIDVPKNNKKKFYSNNIHKASFIIGQPDLPKKLLVKAKKLKAIFNVESNFLDNMDYNYCFQNNIHVLSTSPVFAQPVAEMALGLTLSLARDIHKSHYNFINSIEKYGLENSKENFLLKNKKFGLIGFGDLANALLPLLKAFSNEICSYDPWISNKIIINKGVEPCNLNQLLKTSDIIYVLASITSKNQGLIDKKKLSLIKKNSALIILSRASIINFNDLIKILRKKKIIAAIDVFPVEPVKKNDPMRKLKNVIFSPHRAGALNQVFEEMGNIVYEDILSICNNLPPQLCKKAFKETVGLLRSKPVDIN